MKKTIIYIYVILIVLLLFFLFRYIVNERFISLYEDGKYDEKDILVLSFLNINESYIYHYNLGNLYYKNGEYNKAIEEYEKALELKPSEEKECDIRVNLALAKLQEIEDDYDLSDSKIEETLDILDDARDILLENDCATNDNDGHDDDAQNLKNDIDDFEDSLRRKQEETKKGDSDKDENDKKDEDDSKGREKIKEDKDGAYENRIEGLELTNSLLNEYEYYNGKTW